MTAHKIAIAAAGIALFSGFAVAQDELQLEPVIVRGIPPTALEDCTPPNALDTPLCAAWQDTIRRHFTEREIGMLFGAATSYPEYRTSYSRVKERYQWLQDDFAANYAPVVVVDDY